MKKRTLFLNLSLALVVLLLLQTASTAAVRSAGDPWPLYLPMAFVPDKTIAVAPLLAPFDGNVEDVIGPSNWGGNYGKSPEIITASDGINLDVLAQDYDPATPWKAVLFHIRPRSTGAGYYITQALTGMPFLDRVMGLAVDKAGYRYYATSVEEENWVNATYPPANTYRSDIVRVVKLDADGSVIFNTDLDMARHDFNPGAEMIINPMVAASSRLAVGGSEVALVHGINTGADSKGVRHQKALSTRLDATTGAVTATASVWVSHSFDQRLLFDGQGIIEHHLGDAYPRWIVFGHRDAGQDEDSAHPLFQIKGEMGENRTYTRLGNLALIENDTQFRYLAVFATESSAPTGSDVNGPRNLTMVRAGADGSMDISLPDRLTVISEGKQYINYLKWLTSYTAANHLHAERPKLVALGSNRYVVLWEEWYSLGDYYSDSFNGVFAMLIDSQGTILQPAKRITTAYHLPRGDDAFMVGGSAGWITGSAASRSLMIHLVNADLNYEEVGLE